MPELDTLGPQLAELAEPYMTRRAWYVADEALSGSRVVRLASAPGHVVYARPPEQQALAPLGVTVTAAVSGNTVMVCTSGELRDSGWSWTAGPVLLGPNGTLTQSIPPGATHVVTIGQAIAPDTIIVRIGQAIQLA